MARRISMAAKRIGLLAAVVTVFLAETISAQPSGERGTDRKDAFVWYFGRNAGLSFVDGAPVALTDGRLNTLDGSAVACHPEDGHLLFYTDGATVWSASHKVMMNGAGLGGNESSGQPALIVPAPGDGNLFYIFTTGAANTPDNAFRYSIVDISRNGGEGAVTAKNIVLLERGTEQVTATRHCNGRDYWVVSHQWATNRFYVFPVGVNGVGEPVITEIGEIYPSEKDIQGTMQMSPNGANLAVSAASLKTLEVFDFDSELGAIGNRRVVAEGVRYYGIEFSPDNSRLYTTTLPFPDDSCLLYQIDLTAGSPDDIRASKTLLFGYAGGWIGGQLQSAPDGNIYVSFDGRAYLGVIDEPNKPAPACNYIHEGVNLQGKLSSYGLPNFIDSDVFGAITAVPCAEDTSSVDTVAVDTVRVDTCTTRFAAAVRVRGGEGYESGELFILPVRLEESMDDARISYLSISVGYDPLSMRPEDPGDIEEMIEEMMEGTLLEGWRGVNVRHAGGSFLLELRAPSGSYLRDTGTLLNLRFRMYFVFGGELSADIPLEITAPEDSCATFNSTGGRVGINAICGLNYRLIEHVAGVKYGLEIPRPHPVRGETEIRFSLALDGATRCELLDLSGRVVATLTDDYLLPGEYVVRWNAADLAPGVYFCRLISGEWSAVVEVLVEE